MSISNHHVVQPLQENAVALTNSSATTESASLSISAVTDYDDCDDNSDERNCRKSVVVRTVVVVVAVAE